MGSGSSTFKDLPDNLYLKRFVSDEAITPNDPFWNQFLSFALKIPSSKEEYKSAESIVAPLFQSLIKNNASSGNISALVQVFLSRSSELRLSAQLDNDIFTWQCHNALLLLRFIIKFLFESFPEDEAVSYLQHTPHKDSGHTDDTSKLVESLCSSLIEIIVDVPLCDSNYSLHVEATVGLIVLTSSHLYSSEKTRNIIFRMLLNGKPSLHACLFVKTLLNRFIDFDKPPPSNDASSSFLGFASGIWNALTTGLSLSETEEDAAKEPEFPPLALQSLLLLHVISNHFTSEQGPNNPYRLALLNSQDLQESPEASKHQLVYFKVNFLKLYKRIYMNLHSDQITLLLYILLHKNIDFRTFVLAQTDIEMLIVPILKTLYHASSNSSHHIYMSIIILLIFSEDDCFNKTIHDINLKEIPWYTERQLSNISLGGLLILVLIRMITFNMTKMKDKYLHTNCLAALGNMSSQFRSLHPYVAQKIVNLFESLAKKLSKLCKTVEESENNSQASSISDQSEMMTDIAVSEEVLIMVLEIISNTLTNQLVNNHNLLYTLLYKRDLFEYFSTHPNFSIVCQNIEVVLSFFMNKLEESTYGLSVDEVQTMIQNGVMQFPRMKLKKSVDLKFKYVEENEPEEFFIPYVWTLVYESCGLFWDECRISLFTSLDGSLKHDADK